jgi:hypothetical protein
VGVRKVRWNSNGTQQADEYIVLYGKGRESGIKYSFFARKKIMSAVKKVDLSVIGCHT